MALWRVCNVSSTFLNYLTRPSAFASRNFTTEVAEKGTQSLHNSMMNQLAHLDINSLIGSCMHLAAMHIGTIIHNIEVNPGQGGKLVRAAGTCAKILKEPSSSKCLIRLPSGSEKWVDSRCRASIGVVSNPSHGAEKLRKAGQSRWLGRRPTVRGVAMNPVDTFFQIKLTNKMTFITLTKRIVLTEVRFFKSRYHVYQFF
ncbi:large ribosomal subunit protein uL2m-like [Humulus lupulus]|uniref:large ribosomal subunit protein uL2m-like n=1 Tax=Humulus lupulus TaxID=3486 RepID=UPI002B4095EA|nr:large ribosomal subunit protein uL2m-like [Humulus lupulus]